MKAYLPYGRQSIDQADIDAVVAVLRGDWLTTGPTVERFEAAVADYVGAAHAVCFSSGTAALHGAMHVAGVAPGDVVVVPPLTFAATSNAALYCGGTPLFADIAADTLCMDPIAAQAVMRRAEGPVRAVVPVSFAGYPVDLEAFRPIAAQADALLIEDASHALGAERRGKRVGCEADMTVFSFHPVKHITTAEGGMVATNSGEFAKRLRTFRTHGIVKSPADFVRPYAGAWDNDMIELGYNYRLSDIACALGESQMRRLPFFVERRREIARLYREYLPQVAGVTLPPAHPGHAYHLFPVWVTPACRRDVFMRLREAGIGVQVHYVPVHLHTYYRNRFGFSEGAFPEAERYSAGELSLPMYPDMTDDDVRSVADALAEALRGQASSS
jgi:UDP-4-keto-6-deoxy-N-acetylglucosamine 4-aminotransferase